jgi:hypothetical protein
MMVTTIMAKPVTMFNVSMGLELLISVIRFCQDYTWKKWPSGAAIAKLIGFRFSAAGGSGFGCQEVEVL